MWILFFKKNIISTAVVKFFQFLVHYIGCCFVFKWFLCFNIYENVSVVLIYCIYWYSVAKFLFFFRKKYILVVKTTCKSKLVTQLTLCAVIIIIINDHLLLLLFHRKNIILFPKDRYMLVIRPSLNHNKMTDSHYHNHHYLFLFSLCYFFFDSLNYLSPFFY